MDDDDLLAKDDPTVVCVFVNAAEDLVPDVDLTVVFEVTKLLEGVVVTGTRCEVEELVCFVGVVVNVLLVSFVLVFRTVVVEKGEVCVPVVEEAEFVLEAALENIVVDEYDLVLLRMEVLVRDGLTVVDDTEVTDADEVVVKTLDVGTLVVVIGVSVEEILVILEVVEPVKSSLVVEVW